MLCAIWRAEHVAGGRQVRVFDLGAGAEILLVLVATEGGKGVDVAERGGSIQGLSYNCS